MEATRLLLINLVIFLFSSCSSIEYEELYVNLQKDNRKVVKIDLEFQKQTENDCGPNSLYLMLKELKSSVALETVRSMTFTPGKNGTIKSDIVAAARRLGFAAYKVDLLESFKLVSKLRPVLIFQNLATNWSPFYHYSIFVGYNMDEKVSYLHDGNEAYASYSIKRLTNTWRRGGKWSYVFTLPRDIPDHVEYQEALANGTVLKNIERFEDAKNLFLALVRRSPRRFEAYAGIAEVFYREKKYFEAKTFYEKSLKFSPENKAIKYNLAEIENRLK